MDLLQREPSLLEQRIEEVKHAGDIALPELKYWNYTECAAHPDGPKIDCEYRACGGELFSHQRVGVMWLYLRKKGLLGDLPGVGKTSQALGLAALLKERGELTDRMLIVCQTPATLQWLSEAQRWVPRLQTEAIYSGLTRAQRVQKYVTNWDLLIIGYHMLLQDWELLEKLEIKTIIVDDVDPLLNHDTKTHARIVSLAKDTERCVVMNATSVQTKLEQLHAALLPAGGFEVFGSQSQFEHRFVRKEYVREMKKSGRVVTKEVVVGYRNGEELKKKLSPLFLRRRYEDLTDVKMPTLMPPEHVWLELHKEQKKRYEELRNGVLRLKKDGVEKVNQIQARTIFNYGQQICAGLPALGEEDGKEASVKLDWLVHQVTNAWSDRKVVVFIKNIGMVKAAEARLNGHGVGVAKIWGPDSSPKVRQAEIQRFWKDPNCRVLLGTTAVERSLNLQNANILVNFDTILNPARLSQLAGRVRRAGSKHSHVWVFTLLTRDTQEDGYLDVINKRAAVADYVWSEKSELFEPLSAIELLNLITP